jgi:hypothetical protein
MTKLIWHGVTRIGLRCSKFDRSAAAFDNPDHVDMVIQVDIDRF